jgi:hypothetical protein
MTKFEEAKKDYPSEARFDPFDQKTVDDLVFAVEGELDLVKSGEIHYRDMDGRTKRGIRIRLENFIEKYKNN